MDMNMDKLNDQKSEIFQKTLEEQGLFIRNRLANIKNRYLNDTMGCCGEKEGIASHLNNGPAQNLILTFFSCKQYKTDICVLCDGIKGQGGIRQIQRAHCNLYSRYDLLALALDDLYIDSTTPIKSGDILKKFIQKHDICPIYMLCNLCHNKYDNKKIDVQIISYSTSYIPTETDSEPVRPCTNTL